MPIARSERINIRVTPEFKKLIEELARSRDLTISAYLETLVLREVQEQLKLSQKSKKN